MPDPRVKQTGVGGSELLRQKQGPMRKQCKWTTIQTSQRAAREHILNPQMDLAGPRILPLPLLRPPRSILALPRLSHGSAFNPAESARGKECRTIGCLRNRGNRIKSTTQGTRLGFLRCTAGRTSCILQTVREGTKSATILQLFARLRLVLLCPQMRLQVQLEVDGTRPSKR